MGVDWFSLPIGGGKVNPYLKSESGRPMYETPLGVTYEVKPQAKPDGKRAVLEQMLRGLQTNPTYGAAQAARDVQRRGAEDALRNFLPGMWSGIKQGVEAPGRAAAGEPVTYGDAWATALDYGAIAAPAGKPAGALGGGGLRAYHGSPHDFDQFSMSKIGTGEGAQAYGHGLYFAESEGVARSYRDALKMNGYDNNPIYSKALDLGMSAKEFDAFESIARQTIHDPDVLTREFFNWSDSWRQVADDPAEVAAVRRFAQDYIDSAPSGRMYEVNINADPADFLDWDAPLSEQSPKVREAIRAQAESNFGAGAGDIFAASDNTSVNQFITDIGRSGGIAEQGFSEAGIPGIKYLDAGSRGAGDGSRNFVVFDDRLVEIVRKYGIAGAAAMTGLSVAEIEAGMGQAQAAPTSGEIRNYLDGQ